MESYLTETIEFLTTIIFYGLGFGLVCGLLHMFYTMFTRY